MGVGSEKCVCVCGESGEVQGGRPKQKHHEEPETSDTVSLLTIQLGSQRPRDTVHGWKMI